MYQEPQTGASYSNYGGCYYEIWNKIIHIHIGVSGLTANTSNQIYTLPTAIKPYATIFTIGSSGGIGKYAIIETRGSGAVVAYPDNTYCGADIFYII